jgi:transcription-repair coupling factor (superfamily II helicase)
MVTETRDKRLQVLANLESLGAGFQLASHDLDIRGAGNLLGDEQSGHIKEVGFELYQSMLEEAIMDAKAAAPAQGPREDFSPQITVDAPIMIPDDYVPDLDLRMGLYRRMNELENRRDRVVRGRDDRPLRQAPASDRQSAQGHRDEAQLPQGADREAGRRPEGSPGPLP